MMCTLLEIEPQDFVIDIITFLGIRFIYECLMIKICLLVNKARGSRRNRELLCGASPELTISLVGIIMGFTNINQKVHTPKETPYQS